MKQIHELNERSAALALGDFLPVDNGNDTEKIDYTKLAKAIIEQYNLSSLGGSNRTLKVALDALQDSVDDDLVPKSDIVNNVTTSTTGKVLDASQGKALQDQITALNSSAYLLTGGKIVIAANTNLNTLTDFGEYALTQSAQASTIQNKPSGLNTAFRLRVELMTTANNNYLRQTITVYASSVVYTRYTTNGGSSWTNWETQPTRSEFDELNSKIAPQINLTYDSSISRFVPPSGTAKLANAQLTFVARNVNTGAIYVLYYIYADNNFAVIAIISGSAPSDGNRVQIMAVR